MDLDVSFLDQKNITRKKKVFTDQLQMTESRFTFTRVITNQRFSALKHICCIQPLICIYLIDH